MRNDAGKNKLSDLFIDLGIDRFLVNPNSGSGRIPFLDVARFDSETACLDAWFPYGIPLQAYPERKRSACSSAEYPDAPTCFVNGNCYIFRSVRRRDGVCLLRVDEYGRNGSATALECTIDEFRKRIGPVPLFRKYWRRLVHWLFESMV
ncbi:MAG: hypothetical protein WCJ25_03835 [Candidatus Moraniibacteriota bacterium]